VGIQGALQQLFVTLLSKALAKNLFHGNSTSHKQRIKKGKAKRNDATGYDPIGKGCHSEVAWCVPGLTKRADKPSRTKITRNNWSIRRDLLEDVWNRMNLRLTVDVFADDHNHHLPGFWTYSPSPHAPGTTTTTPASTSAHQPPMGNDSPNSGKHQSRRNSAGGPGPPVAVGLVFAHTGLPEAGSTIHHIRETYKDQYCRLAPPPRQLTQVCLRTEAIWEAPQRTRSIFV